MSPPRARDIVRTVVLALLALILVAPAVWAHGAGLHLSDVKLSYAPLDAGQRLTFTVRNDAWEDGLFARAHVSVQDAIMRTSHPVPDIRYGESVDVDLVLSARVAPKACVVVTATMGTSEEVCALALGVST